MSLGCVAYNLGTGCGTSVLEMVAAFEMAAGKVSFMWLVWYPKLIFGVLTHPSCLLNSFRKSLSSCAPGGQVMPQQFMLLQRRPLKNSAGSKFSNFLKRVSSLFFLIRLRIIFRNMQSEIWCRGDVQRPVEVGEQ